MGCASSVPKPTKSGVVAKDTGEFKIGEELAGKGSMLFCPPAVAAGSRVPSIVMVHGTAAEGWVGDAIYDALMTKVMGRALDYSWQGLKDLATALAEQGFAVLVFGMPDHDEAVYEENATAIGKLENKWPCKDYSRFLGAAIDHLKSVAPKHGITVDEKRIGLVGHSMGGAGVLTAAAKDCKDKVAAVVALNPGFHSVERPMDHVEFCKKFFTGAPHSGENGDATESLNFLGDITAPTLIFGSQAEYNTELMAGSGAATLWPVYTSLFEKVGSSAKELYVDNLTDNPGAKAAEGDKAAELADGAFYAHMWPYGDEAMRKYGDGTPLAAIGNFLKRRLAGSAEAAMPKPPNAKEWVAPTAVEA